MFLIGKPLKNRKEKFKMKRRRERKEISEFKNLEWKLWDGEAFVYRRKIVLNMRQHGESGTNPTQIYVKELGKHYQGSVES